MKAFLFYLIAAIGLGFCLRVDGEDQPGIQQPRQLDTQVTVKMRYLLYLPKEYNGDKPVPMLLFLHGAGERGDNLDLVKVHGPPKLIAAGQAFPFIVVAPQCPANQWWEPIELVALMDDISRKYKVDQERVYVSGLSMGGFGTWRLAAYAPNRLAAIAPICGGGETHWVRQFKHIPVWAFHGAKDQGVPLERSQSMISALERTGAKPKLTVYPEAGHDSWTETYNNPELYTWLLEQKRSPQKESP